MEMTISGSMSVGRIAYAHDKRTSKELPKNVDKELSKYNVTFVDRLEKYDGSAERYVDDKFQGDIEKYNVGKKPCRQIKVPYSEYRKQNKNLNKSPLMYEAVMQFGDHESIGADVYDIMQNGNEESKLKLRDTFAEVYKEALNEMRTRYPHIHIVGAYLHFDEPNGTPHMHIQYIPIGHPDKGLPVQVSIGRALAEDGFERVQSRAEAQKLGGYQMAKWFKDIKENIVEPQLRKLMHKLGIEEYKIKDVQHGREHLDVETYKAVKHAEKQLEGLKEQALGTPKGQALTAAKFAAIATKKLSGRGVDDMVNGWWDDAREQAIEALGIDEKDAGDGIDEIGENWIDDDLELN